MRNVLYTLINCKFLIKLYHKIYVFRFEERVECYLYKFTDLNAKGLAVYSEREIELHAG